MFNFTHYRLARSVSVILGLIILGGVLPARAVEDPREPEPITSLEDRLLEPPAPRPARAPELTPENFPRMPNGLSQIELIDMRFPASGDLRLRRAALEKTLQDFPRDGETSFRAHIRLAELNYYEGKPWEAWLGLKAMLDAPPPEVFHGEYLRAEARGVMFLAESNHEAEALVLAHKLIAEPKASPRSEYKAFAYYYAAKIIAPRSLNEALTDLRAGLELNSSAQPNLFALQIHLLEEHGRDAEVRGALKDLIAHPPKLAAAMLARTAREAGRIFPPARSEEAEALLKVLEETARAFPPDQKISHALEQAHATVRLATAAPAIQEKLRAYLAQNPPAELDAAGKKFTREQDLARAAWHALSENDLARGLRYTLEILSQFKPEADYDVGLWYAVAAAERIETSQGKPEPLLAELLDLADDLPKGGQAYLECRDVRASGCKRRGDFAGACAIHEKMLQIPELSRWGRLGAEYELARDRELQHDYAGALDFYRQASLEPETHQSQDAVVRGVLLALEEDHPKEALQFLEPFRLGQIAPSQRARYGWQFQDLLALARDPERARDYWVDAAVWWPAWEEFETKLGLAPLAGERIIPALENPALERSDTQKCLAAKERENFLAHLRLFAHTARWSPTFAAEFAEMLPATASLLPEKKAEVGEFVLAFTQAFRFDDQALQQRVRAVRLAELIEAGKFEEGWAEVRAFARLPVPDPNSVPMMAILEGSLALKSETNQPEAIAALEQLLASPNFLLKRPFAAVALADLYRQAGRPAEEIKVLEHELASPALKSNPDDEALLRARLKHARGAT